MAPTTDIHNETVHSVNDVTSLIHYESSEVTGISASATPTEDYTSTQFCRK